MTFEILESCSGCGMCLSICPVKAIAGGPGRRHTIDSDLCIGCMACARVCMNSAVVGSDGTIVQREAKKSWLVPHFDSKKCRRCGMCYSMCPAFIITKVDSCSLPSLTNVKLCASCHICEKVCPTGAVVFSVASGASESGDQA